MTKTVKVLETSEDYAAALERVEQLMERDDPRNDAELEALVLLAEHYEKTHFPIEEPDPIDAILFRMAAMGLSQAEVSRQTRIGRSHVSEILRRVRPLSLHAIRSFSQTLSIPAEVLIQPYDRVADNHEQSTDGD